MFKNAFDRIAQSLGKTAAPIPRDSIRGLLQRRRVPGDLEQVVAQRMAPVGGPAMYDPRPWGGEGENYIGHMAVRGYR